MSDIQNPANFINTSHGFDFSTLTGQTPTNSPDVDLSDKSINLGIVDYLNTTTSGSYRPFLNGKISQDPDEGFYYLTGNPDLTGTMTFTQSQDDIDAGRSITMPLSGGLTDENQAFLTIDGKAHRPRNSTSYRTQEAAAITQAFSDHGHNSYAYRPYLHPDHDETGLWKTNEFIEPLTQGAGVYTTRMLDLKSHNFPGGNGRSVINAGYLNGLSSNKQYKTDGITVDRIKTFYAQQSRKFSWNKYQAKHGRSISNRTAMYGNHYALSMAIKLGSDIQEGEYVPFLMISRLGAGVVARSFTGADAAQRDIEKRISACTGSEYESDDWYKHMIQYHFLTADSMTNTKRNIKQTVMYIGKPVGGNTLGGQYEWIVWNAGFQEFHSRIVVGPQKFSSNTSFQPSMNRIPIDDATGSFDASTWQPFFYHVVGSSSHTTQRGRKTTAYIGYSYRPPSILYRSMMAMSMGAFGPGIQDLEPLNVPYSEMYSCVGHSATGGYGRKFSWSKQQAHDHRYGASAGYYLSFITVPGKVEGIANINTHTYNDYFYVPDQPGEENDQRSLTYFPQRTVQYEAIGAGCEIDATQSWESADMLLDGNLETSTSGFAVGEDNYIEIKTKRAPSGIDSELEDDSLMKYMELEVRNASKKYMNPALKFKYSLWNYENELNPYQVTEETSIAPIGREPENSRLVFNVDMTDNNITYGDLNNMRLRLWVDG